MRLYEIKEDMRLTLEGMETLDEDSIEYDVAIAGLSKLEDDFNDKAKNVAGYCENIKADIDSMKKYESNMRDRRKKLESHYKRLRDYLLYNMQETGITRIKCLEFDVSLRKTPDRVIIDSASSIPKNFISSTEIKFDKTAIKKAIKAGEEVFGAHLESGQTVTIK